MRRLLTVALLSILLITPAIVHAQEDAESTIDPGSAPWWIIGVLILAAAITWAVIPRGKAEAKPEPVAEAAEPEAESEPEPEAVVEAIEPEIVEPEPEPVVEAVEPEPEPEPEPFAEAAEPEVVEPEPEPEPEPVVEAEPDDLRIIEGIGPKVSQALQDAGITTFAQVAATDAAQLEKTVKDAGVRVVKGASETWPEQAALAAAGKWDELEQLQEQLKGGRRAG